MIQSNNINTRANWLIWCVENDSDFVAIGSRTVSYLDLEADIQMGDYWETRDFLGNHIYSKRDPASVRQYKLTGALVGFTMVTGKTELEAICSLITAFKEEERREQQDRENAVAARIKTEKIEEKKAKKKHKKAMKQAREGKFDAAKCPEDCIYCEQKLDDSAYDYDEEVYYDWHDSAEEY